MSHFFFWKNRNNNRTCLKGLSWKLDEFVCMKRLEQCVIQSKYCICLLSSPSPLFLNICPQPFVAVSIRALGMCLTMCPSLISMFSEPFHKINWYKRVLQFVLEFLAQRLRILALEPDFLHKIPPLLLASYVILGKLFSLSGAWNNNGFNELIYAECLPKGLPYGITISTGGEGGREVYLYSETELLYF